jgi:hypothetical protein
MLTFARLLPMLVAVLPGAGCTFHNTATHWNGRVGVTGKPIYVKTSTNVGFNLLVLLPILGRTSMDEMIDATSEEISRYGSDRLRVIQTSSENYWYGFPPFTRIITPVITDIAIEYEPTEEEVHAVIEELYEEKQRARKRSAKRGGTSALPRAQSDRDKDKEPEEEPERDTDRDPDPDPNPELNEDPRPGK